MKAIDYLRNLNDKRLSFESHNTKPENRYYVVFYNDYAVDYFKPDISIEDYMLQSNKEYLITENIREKEYYNILGIQRFLREQKLKRILK